MARTILSKDEVKLLLLFGYTVGVEIDNFASRKLTFEEIANVLADRVKSEEGKDLVIPVDVGGGYDRKWEVIVRRCDDQGTHKISKNMREKLNQKK
jgi:hypothetical protein